MERGRWHPRSSFRKTLDEILARVDSATYFNQPSKQMQQLRDAWIAGEFACLAGAEEVMLPTDDWPDFSVKLSDGRVVQCEATEAMEDGPKRGHEYKEWKRTGYRLRQVNEEKLEARRVGTLGALQSAVQRKINKGYPRVRLYSSSI